MDNIEKLLDIPLAQAEGHLKEVLIKLAESFHETNWRPCLDGETTLRDWIEVLV